MRRVYLTFGMLFFSSMIASAGIRTYGFDDGTFQGWDYVNLDMEPYPVDDVEQTEAYWKLSLEEVDLGENGWNLLQGSTENGIGEVGNPQREPNYRFIPEPWANRDCIGNICQTQLFISPAFQLDDSGPITVDIMGGAAQGGRAFDPEIDIAPEIPDDLDFEKNGTGWQGFALYDQAAEQYVRWAFPSFTNDGKEKDGRDVWETVEIPAEELTELAGDGKDYEVHIFDSYSGGWGWIGFDTVQVPDAAFSSAFDCDGDGMTGAGDLGCITTVEDRDTVLSAIGSLPGDLDGDGSVAFADFLVLSSNFGNTEGTYAEGNIDMMGGIEFADFLEMSANFGQTAAASSVPEPSGIACVLPAALVLLGRRRRR